MQPLIEAQSYKIKLYQSAMKFVHGDYDMVTEIYVPSHAIAFNTSQGTLHVFEIKKIRSDDNLINIMIEQPIADELKNIAQLNTQLNLRKHAMMSKAELYTHV